MMAKRWWLLAGTGVYLVALGIYVHHDTRSATASPAARVSASPVALQPAAMPAASSMADPMPTESSEPLAQPGQWIDPSLPREAQRWPTRIALPPDARPKPLALEPPPEVRKQLDRDRNLIVY